MSSNSSGELLGNILRDVSRSFYLTLRALPRSVRKQIGLAYLLARTTDTIADTEIVPADKRLEALQVFRERICRTTSIGLNFAELAKDQSTAAERVLLERAEDSLRLLQNLESWDREQIVKVLAIITTGQEEDLRRFSGSSVSDVRALRTEQELDDYTYQVAGCVGEFWTRMCRRHVFPEAVLEETLLLERGVRFGKGLQLVNILRDVPSDLRIGRCYMPADELAQAGLAPTDLLDPAVASNFRPVCDAWLDRAEAHLRQGWVYTNCLPFRCMRIRLACSWPLLIGFQTLKLLRRENLLDPAQKVKVSRQSVRNIIRRSIIWYLWPSRWKKLAES